MPNAVRRLSSTLRSLVPQSLASRASLAISAVFLVGMVAMTAVSLSTFDGQLAAVLRGEQDLLVGRVAEDVDQRIDLLQSALRDSAARIDEGDLSSFTAARAALERNDGLASVFDRSVFLFSAKGTLLSERPFRTDRLGQDATWRPYIRKTMETGRPVISEPFKTNAGDGNFVMVLTMPVRARDGRLIGLLTGSLDLTRPDLLGSVAKLRIGRSGYVTIATAEGKLIIDPDSRRLSSRPYPPGANAPFDRALKGFEGTAESVDETGRPAFVTYHHVRSAGWMVSAVYPRDEAYEYIHHFVRNFLLALAAAAIAVLLAIWYLTRYLTRPLDALSRHMSGYSATKERIAPMPGESAGSGEVRALTTAFNALTRRLNEREESMISALRQYQVITESSTDLITRHARDGEILFASPACRRVLGVDEPELIGRHLADLVHPDDLPRLLAAFDAAWTSDAATTVAYRARLATEDYVWLESALRPLAAASGRGEEILCLSRDIDERKRMEEKLHRESRHDSLTQLPNRLLLDERLPAAMTRCYREGSLLAVLLIDLDRFKDINDTLGHRSGDELLTAVAARFASCTRAGDTVARWGGDEFVVVLPGIVHPEVARGVADRYMKALKAPFEHDGRTLHVTASIGIAVAGDGLVATDELLANADVAMYRAKRRGGNASVTYASEMNEGAHDRLSMENALFHAVDRDELRLHYQPLVSARSGRIVAVEALLRWQHPEFGLVSPGVFIPVAERIGVIADMGDWALRTACAQMAEWHREGLDGLGLSVNISGRQFTCGTLVGTVRDALADSGLPASCLELELTETLLMENNHYSQETLAALKRLGVTIALDDFGVGYSSLSYLKQFTLDTLKVDRAFTSEMLGSSESEAIVRATFDISRALKLRTVAEGVETRAQANFLAELGCDVLQGYHFAKPMPADQVLGFVQSAPIHLFPRPAAPVVAVAAAALAPA
jgi:diguanylate cyclase (GGDEF)-like protein/PAS domain S-box-containing protein